MPENKQTQSQQKEGNNKDQTRNRNKKTIEKINETKSWLFGSLNKIDNLEVNHQKKKKTDDSNK